MPGISSILDMGKWALFGSQAAIETTGSNIANVNTVGYSRRSVVFQENVSLNYRPGQLGTGVVAKEVIRNFDEFVESQYLDKHSREIYYETLYKNLTSVDGLFNESNTDGLSAAMNKFFSDWNDLSLRPEDYATREQLLGDSQSLISLFQNMNSDLRQLQQLAEEEARQDVDEVNTLLKRIADLNKQINAYDIPGSNNANSLYDQRDQALRLLSEKMDIQIANRGLGTTGLGGDIVVTTLSGHTLVQSGEAFTMAFEGPQTTQGLTTTSTFDGTIKFGGADDFEYTIEVVKAGDVSNATDGSAAQFRVSLDGGKTWLTDENGQQLLFDARPESGKVQVRDIEIWFDNATQPLSVGDKFSIMPRSGIYWYENTSNKVNLTPVLRGDGTVDKSRLTGGSLAALMNFVGPTVGGYSDKLDALAKSLIWNVNRQHSQGAGLVPVTEMLGTYSVRDTSLALGSNSSGLAFAEYMSDSPGNVNFYVYDTSTGKLVSNTPPASFGPLDFDAVTPGIQNFDPSVHTLEDVRDAINDTFGAYLTADIVNNQLRIRAEDGYSFALGADTVGLSAALGLNTFFTGTNASNLGINPAVLSSADRINAGHINGAGELNFGDNTMAQAIAKLQTTNVTIISSFGTSSNQTLSDYYATLVATAGTDTAGAKFGWGYNKALADDLDERQQAVAGVNLDEEMAALIKFQSSYKAAAKLITTADEMLQIVLGLKQ
ncbi:MAG: flagellar hook-associated protein FlgK [Desulfovibrio sp.]|nr:flagellar hook-associated protein FlgK [Desulfovibrio sp.]